MNTTDLQMKANTVPVNVVVRTDGTSIWCNAGPRDVQIRGLHLQLSDADGDLWGLLTAYTSISGLEIYTDDGYLNALNAFLQIGMQLSPVDYSEQGMQSETYTHHDVDYEFISRWLLHGYPYDKC